MANDGNVGGLDYRINVGGDWKAELDAFEGRINKLKADAAKLGTGTSGKKVSLQDQQKLTKLTELEKAQQNEALSILKKKTQQLQESLRIARQLQQVQAKDAQKTNLQATKQEAVERQKIAKAQKEAMLASERERKAREAVSSKDAQRSSAQAVKDEADERSRIAKLQRESILANEKDRKATEAKAAKEAQLAEKARQYNDIGLQASQRNLSAKRELQIKEAQINDLMRSQGISARKAAEQVGLTSAQAKQLKLNMWDAEHAARQFLFTFRRLVGILAVFTLARKFAQALGAGVKEMIRMNSEIETAKNSIATLISSVGRVYDAQGNLLTGQKAFTAALEQSDAVVKQLQRDAVGSVATFEALTKAFQVAAGPGLAAGLDIKQITTVTKRLVEGAVAMKVPLEQMSEEIRSILQGTATSKNTRLVSLFGGSAAEVNEQIRQAKEQGRLYEFLTEKLAQVGFGALNAASSMEVLKSDLQDTASLLAKEGGIAYFNELKEAILGLRNALAQTNGEGFVFNPEALGIVQEVSNALAGVIRSFREITDTQTNLDFLRSSLATIADLLAVIAPFAFAVFQGIVTGLNAIIAPIRVVLDGMRELAEFFGLKTAQTGLAQILKYLVAGAVYLAIWVRLSKALAILQGAKGLAAVWPSIVKGIVSAALAMKVLTQGTVASIISMNGLAGSVRLVGAALYTALGPLGLILLAVSAIASAFGVWKLASRKINDPLKDVNKEMEKLETLTRGALADVGDMRAEYKNMAEEVKKLNEETALISAMAGVSDSAKALVEEYVKRRIAVEDVTKTEREGITLAQEKLDLLRKQRQELISYLLLNKANLSKEEIYNIAARNMEFLKQEGKLQSQISILESDRITKVRQINTATASRLKKIQAENDAAKLSRSLEIQSIEASAALEAEQKRARGESFADLVIAESKLAVLKEQAEAQRISNERTNEELATSLKTVDAMADATKNAKEEMEAAQAQLAELKPPVLDVELNKKKLKDQIKQLDQDLLAVQWQGQGLDTLENARARTSIIAERKKAQEQLNELALSGTTKEYDLSKKKYEDEKAVLEERLSVAKQESDVYDQSTKNREAIIERQKTVQQEQINAQRKADAERIKLERERWKAAKEASDRFSDGVLLGLDKFVQSTGTFASQVSEITSGALSSLASTVAGVFKDAIDPRKDVDLRTAFGEFFLSIAGDFVEAITKQLLAQAVGSMFDLSGNAVLLANTAAIQANTAAMTGVAASTTGNTAATVGDTAATSADAAATTANTGGLLANTGALFSSIGTMISTSIAWIANTAATLANTAMVAVANTIGALAGAAGSVFVVAAIAAQTAVQSALLLLIAGLLLTANTLLASIAFATFGDWMTPFPFKKGGEVPKGYADGGSIGIPRPAHIPASDTVPAWLTPGEYVLPVPLVRKLGVGFLEKLRAGVVSPSSFHSAAASSLGLSNAVRGYAMGGPVMTTATTQAASQQTIVLPVMPANDNTLDQMLTGGRKTFNKKLNQANIVGDPNATKRW